MTSMATGWPAVLAEGNVTLRPLRRSDAHAWLALRSDPGPTTALAGRLVVVQQYPLDR